MHPAMALWIFSVSMSRAWQSSLLGDQTLPVAAQMPSKPDPVFVRADAYLHSDLAKNPLPDIILDRLADLYWAERDSELAI